MTVTQWEYKVGSYRGLSKGDREQMLTDLNKMGEQGWEAVNITASDSGGPLHVLYKRPTAQNPSSSAPA